MSNTGDRNNVAHATSHDRSSTTRRSAQNTNAQTTRGFETPKNADWRVTTNNIEDNRHNHDSITELEARIDESYRDRSERETARKLINRDNTGEQRNVAQAGYSRRYDNIPILEHMRVIYGRTEYDVRNSNTGETYLRLKNAVNLISPFDGKTSERTREFLNACSYAVTSIHPVDEIALLRTIMCIKLRGKALYWNLKRKI